MKLKIERLNEKEISTSRGLSTKIGVYFGGKWYGAWKGQWNSGWKVGQTIDIPDDRITSNTSNGKTFWNIAGPPQQKTNGTAVDGQLLHKLTSLLEEIKSDLTAIKDHLGLETTSSGSGDYQEQQPEQEEQPF
jgi:hypothetical protein